MRFNYTARDEKGGVHKGVIEAGQAKIAAVFLKERRLIPVAITPVRSWLNIGSGLSKMRRVTVVEVANFTRQLATMITAGLPLTDGLNLLKLQASVTFAPVIGSIFDNVQAGVSLSDSLARHPKVFSTVYVALVKAGEAAGVLETILNRLADSLEKSREFRAKVVGAMIYPVIVLVGMVGVMAVMVIVVIPRLSVLYTEFGTQLPLATRVLVFLSNLATRWLWLVLPLGVGVGYGGSRYLRQPQGKRQWDSLVYKIPVAGPLLSQMMLTELTRTLSLLIGAGVSVIEALNIVASALDNTLVELQVRAAAKKVEKGFPLSISFSESGLFPPMLGQMFAVGEETGKLDDVLAKLAVFYEAETERKVKALTTAIEPLIIVLLGVGVGLLIFSIVMPIYNLTSQF